MFRRDRFKALRIEQGLTHEEIAERLDVGISSINRWENGKTAPKGEVVSQIATVLNVSTDYLLGLTDDPTGQLTMDDLSPMERKLIVAVRQGLIREAVKTFA